MILIKVQIQLRCWYFASCLQICCNKLNRTLVVLYLTGTFSPAISFQNGFPEQNFNISVWVLWRMTQLTSRVYTQYWVDENEARRDFNITFKKMSIHDWKHSLLFDGVPKECRRILEYFTTFTDSTWLNINNEIIHYLIIMKFIHMALFKTCSYKVLAVEIMSINVSETAKKQRGYIKILDIQLLSMNIKLHYINNFILCW